MPGYSVPTQLCEFSNCDKVATKFYIVVRGSRNSMEFRSTSKDTYERIPVCIDHHEMLVSGKVMPLFNRLKNAEREAKRGNRFFLRK